MIKTLQKVSTEGTYLNIIKAIYDKPTANILNGEKLKEFPLRSGTRQGCPLSSLLFSTLTSTIQHNRESLSHNREEKERKRIQIGTEEVKLSLIADGMILYIENPKDATRKLLEIINEFGKASGYKVHIQKSIAFLCTNNEISERN